MLFVFAQTSHQWSITFEIKGYGLRHGTPENFPIGTIINSPNDQIVSGQFTDYFWVEDILGEITGHYTTIQCDGIYGPNSTILTGIELKAWSSTPTLLLWTTWAYVAINPSLSTYHSIIEPITYIYKSTHPSNAWIVNKYGDRPWIKILIPGNTPPGMYSGTIVFSLYTY